MMTAADRHLANLEIDRDLAHAEYTLLHRTRMDEHRAFVVRRQMLMKHVADKLSIDVETPLPELLELDARDRMHAGIVTSDVRELIAKGELIDLYAERLRKAEARYTALGALVNNLKAWKGQNP